jgi:hypothetical protein
VEPCLDRRPISMNPCDLCRNRWLKLSVPREPIVACCLCLCVFLIQVGFGNPVHQTSFAWKIRNFAFGVHTSVRGRAPVVLLCFVGRGMSNLSYDTHVFRKADDAMLRAIHVQWHSVPAAGSRTRTEGGSSTLHSTLSAQEPTGHFLLMRCLEETSIPINKDLVFNHTSSQCMGTARLAKAPAMCFSLGETPSYALQNVLAVF